MKKGNGNSLYSSARYKLMSFYCRWLYNLLNINKLRGLS